MNQFNKKYRFSAIALAALMFFTSMSFAVDVHYCQGQLKSISFFGEAQNCHDKVAANPNCKHHPKAAQDDKVAMNEKDCCQNENFVFQADLDQQIQTVDFTLNQQQTLFLTAYVTTFFQAITFKKDVHHFEQYKPPLIPKDIPVLLESFLI